jgi:ankyrin repeat protein
VSIDLLFRAIRAGDVEQVKLLVDSGLDINDAGNTAARSPLLAVAEEADRRKTQTDPQLRAILRLLIDGGADPNTRHESDLTPLGLASMNLVGWMVEDLIRAGADPLLPDSDGYLPAFLAGASGMDGQRENAEARADYIVGLLEAIPAQENLQKNTASSGVGGQHKPRL